VPGPEAGWHFRFRVNRTGTLGVIVLMNVRGEPPQMAPPVAGAGTGRLRALFERRYLPMVHVAQLLLGDRASAEDVAQEAFARLHTRLDRLTEPDAADAYLRAMVVNLSRSALRNRRVTMRYEQRQPDPEPSAGDGAAALADHEASVTALRRLSRRQRECLVLRYYLDLPRPTLPPRSGSPQDR
jgi:RNA polymerase sigma factor (sigma-70 family)